MTPYPHTHYMTLKEWKEWKVNYENYAKTRHNKPIKLFMLIHINSKFSYFISASFDWKSSPEGHDYWNKIAQRTNPVE